MKLLSLSLTILACATLVGAWPKDLQDEEPISISGFLSTKIFPGLPNYESVAAGDRSEEAWLLTSETVSPGSKEKTEAYQLVFLSDFEKTFATLRRLLGKRVSVEGTIWIAHTGHHHTRFLITLKAIKETPNQAEPQTPARKSGP